MEKSVEEKRKPKTEIDDPEQSIRFEELARQVEAQATEAEFSNVIGHIASTKPKTEGDVVANMPSKKRR